MIKYVSRKLLIKPQRLFAVYLFWPVRELLIVQSSISVTKTNKTKKRFASTSERIEETMEMTICVMTKNCHVILFWGSPRLVSREWIISSATSESAGWDAFLPVSLMSISPEVLLRSSNELLLQTKQDDASNGIKDRHDGQSFLLKCGFGFSGFKSRLSLCAVRSFVIAKRTVFHIGNLQVENSERGSK